MHYNTANKHLKNCTIVLQLLGEIEHSAVMSMDLKLLSKIRQAQDMIRDAKDALMEHKYAHEHGRKK